MKFVLFCQHSYSYGILEPIRTVLIDKKIDYTWFITKNLVNDFPYKNEPYITDVKELKDYKSDAIFAPGNYVPNYVRGLKVQVFHGLAGEKRAHFKIRHFFDLYLTQGPYFTSRFNELKDKFKDFDVIETGWSKLDKFNVNKSLVESQKKELLEKNNAEKLILYAPTFNDEMISSPHLVGEFDKLAQNEKYLIVVKFHILTPEKYIEEYTNLSKKHKNIIISSEPNITNLMTMSDLLISDTSSVVYEFQLLNKPVLTFGSMANTIEWDNSIEFENLSEKVNDNLTNDTFKIKRQNIIANYHPYNDGNSSLRMVDAVLKVISEKGVPLKRKVSLSRKFKIYKIFTLRNK